MLPRFSRTLGVVLLALLLPLSGCNETGDLTRGSVDQLLANARIARQARDYETAVRILDAALATAPDRADVRTEFGLTLLERDDLNLLDLDRVAAFVTSTSSGTRAAPAARVAVCTFETDPTARPFRLDDVDGFSEIEARRATLDRTLALLDPVIPNSLQSLDLCTGVTDGPDGPMLAYDRAAALAQMRAANLTDAEISAALASNALARFLNAYLMLARDLPQPTTWYRIDSGSGIGVCAADPIALLNDARPAVAGLGEGAASVDLRAAAFGASPTSQGLVDLVTDGFVDVRDAIGPYCFRPTG